MAKPLFVGNKEKASSRIQSTQKNQQAMKNIVDPFLQWYNELFNLQYDSKTFGEASTSREKSMVHDNNGFEVNEETLFNILSADMQGTSKIQPFHTFHALPTIPPSIAERTNLQKKTYSFKLNECCTERESKRGTVKRIELADRIEDIEIGAYSTSNNFVSTKNLCENLKDLTIMKNFLNNSDEFASYDAGYEHSKSSSSHNK